MWNLKDWISREFSRGVARGPRFRNGTPSGEYRRASEDRRSINRRKKFVRRSILILLGAGVLTVITVKKCDRMQSGGDFGLLENGIAEIDNEPAVKFDETKSVAKTAAKPTLKAVAAQPTPELAAAKEIEETDNVIAKAEKGFEQFEAMMRPKLAAVRDPVMKAELEASFAILRINKKNPHKNGPRFAAQKGEAQIAIPNIYFFFYKAGETGEMAAGFSPVKREMILSAKLDPSNLLDMLILHHELKHAAVDSNVRKGIRSREDLEKYRKFFTTEHPHEKPRIIINDEAGAYAFELELLNLMLDGALRASSADGGKPLDPELLRRKLNARRDQIETIDLLLELARLYFPAGTPWNMPKAFLDEIATKMQAAGFEIYVWGEGGRLKRYR